MASPKRKSKKVREYYGGRIRPLVEHVVKTLREHPHLLHDMERLHTSLSVSVPGYSDKGTCFNCQGSMEISIYTAGIMEGLLLKAMAAAVRDNMRRLETTYPDERKRFTAANLVHVPTLPVSDATRHAITRASYLGLVHQPDTKKGSGHWLITHWGWKLLRGEQVSRAAKYWRGKLVQRSTYMTDMHTMFATHTQLVEAALRRRKTVRSDYRADISDWNPKEWVGFGGYVEDQKDGV